MRNSGITAPCGARVAQQLDLPCTICPPGQLQRVWELGHANFGMVALGCSSSGSTAPSLQETQHVLGLDLPHSQFLEKGRNWKTGLALPPSSPRGSDIWFLGPDRLCWSVQVLPATM